jgi:AcrR family transcriptional regulator
MSESRALPRGRHRLSREAVAESQRERMLDAIAELVAEHGYAHSTVGGIAAKAGVSRTTFYEQFDSKEDCFHQAFEAVAEQLIEAMEGASKPIKEPRKALAAGVRAALEWFAERPAAAATFIVEVHTVGPEALDQRAAIFKRFCEVLDERAPDRPPSASMAVVTSADAMAHELVRRGRARELPKLTDDVLYVAERLLG